VTFGRTSSRVFAERDIPLSLAPTPPGGARLVTSLLKERRRDKRGLLATGYAPPTSSTPLVYGTAFHLPSPFTPQGELPPSSLTNPTQPPSPSISPPTSRKQDCKLAGLKPISHAGNVDIGRLLTHAVTAEGDEANMRSIHRILTSAEAFRSTCLKDGPPPPTDRPPARDSMLTEADVTALVKWGVLGRSSRREWRRLLGFAFKVWKSDGITTRFILDCFRLNDWSRTPPPFRIAQPREVAQLLASFPFAWSVDMKNWFFQIAIPEAIRMYFALRGKGSILHMLVLAMGWCWAPYIGHSITYALSGASVFTFDLKSVAAVILDNSLLVSSSLRLLRERRLSFIRNADNLGAVIGDSDDLALTAGTRVTHGGVRYWTLPILVWALKPTVAARIAADLSIALHPSSRIPWKRWRSILGSVVWAVRVLEIPLVCIAGAWDWAAFHDRTEVDENQVVSLWPSATTALHNLALWLQNDPHVTWCTRRKARILLWTDASRWGWGAVLWAPFCGWISVGRPWSTSSSIRAAASMPWAEAAGFARSLDWLRSLYPKEFSTMETQWVGDCQPAIFAAESGRSSSTRLAAETRRGYRSVLRGHGSISFSWTPTGLQYADSPSRGKGFSTSANIVHPLFIPSASRWWFPMALPSSPSVSPPSTAGTHVALFDS
jgi:hypothetical protein